MKPNKERQAGTTDDSSTKVQDMQVSQHSRKPNVIGSFLSTDKNRTDFKETELRIGNVIYYQSSEDGLLPNIVDWQDLKWLSENPDSFNETFKPIPISWVVLEHLGWGVEDCSDHHYLSKQVGEWGLFTLLSDGNGLSYVHHNSSISKTVKYYHQLENIFYFTTGFYLDDKLEDLEVEKLVFKILSDGSNTDEMPF